MRRRGCKSAERGKGKVAPEAGEGASGASKGSGRHHGECRLRRRRFRGAVGSLKAQLETPARRVAPARGTEMRRDDSGRVETELFEHAPGRRIVEEVAGDQPVEAQRVARDR